MKQVKYLALVLMLMAGLSLLAGGCARGQTSNYPSKAIDAVVHTDPGGSSDIFVRMVTDLVQKNNFSSQPFNVVNKGGGSGAVATTYLMEKKGDPYTFMAYATAIGSTMARGQVPAKLTEFTPISLLQIDPSVVMVRADSPYNSLKDLIEAAKAKPKQVSLGFGSIGGTDHILMFRVQKATGAQFNFLSFKSGGEASTQMLGGHVDFTMGQPAEARGQLDAKKVKVLATFTEKRIPMLPDVPTAKEQGVDIPSRVLRGMIGPQGMPKEAVTYLDGVFKKVTETQAWKDYIAKDGVESAYMGPEEFGKLLKEEEPLLDSVIGEMGLKEKK